MHSLFCVLHVEFSGTQTSVHFPGCVNLCLNDFQFSRKQSKLTQFWRKTTKCHVCITWDEKRIFAQKNILLSLTNFGSDLLVTENKIVRILEPKGYSETVICGVLAKGMLAGQKISFSTYLKGSINDKASSYRFFCLTHVLWQFYH